MKKDIRNDAKVVEREYDVQRSKTEVICKINDIHRGIWKTPKLGH